MPASVLDSATIVKALKENLQLCVSNYRINSLLIVTRASLVGDLEEQAKVRNSIATNFGFPEANVYMMDNYTKEKEKSMRVDKMVLEILMKSIEGSRDFQTQNRQYLVSDIKAKTKACPTCKQPIEVDWAHCPLCYNQ